MLKKIFAHDDKHEFKPLLVEIEDRPLSPLGRFTFWTIISVVAFFVIWMFFGKVDVVITSRGQVLPEGNIKILQPLSTGVLSHIHVSEGDYVSKGQVLMEIDPSTTEPELDSLGQNLKNLDLEIEKYEALIAGKAFTPNVSNYDDYSIKIQTDIYNSLLDGHNKKLKVNRAELAKIKEQIASTKIEKQNYSALKKSSKEKLDRLDKVRDIISDDEYQKAKNEYLSYSNSVDELTHKLNELNHQIKIANREMELLNENFQTTMLEQLSQKQSKKTEVEARIKEITFMNTKQKILSPVDGYVNNIFIHTKGGVVTSAQKLISVVPKEAKIVVKARVANKDIGFVKKDMDVALKIDTFSFQKYGIVNGKVLNVAKDSIPDEKMGFVYEVYIEPLEKFLIVERRKEPITTGMSVTAEIKIGKRRIIEFFIYPLIKYWDEGMSVK